MCCQEVTENGVAIIPPEPADPETNQQELRKELQNKLQKELMIQGSLTLPDQLEMYTVTLSKTKDESFGVSFDATDPNRPVVIGILPNSALGRSISASSSSRYPKVGSALVAVDGKASSGADMVKALKTSGLISATFKEPRIKTITIPEGEGPLGLQVRQSRELGLLVTSSSLRAAAAGVQARDYIVAVNGEKKNRLMLEMLQASKDHQAHQLEVWSYNEEARLGMVTIPKGPGALGLELQPVTTADNTGLQFRNEHNSGLQVVNATGRAAAAGLRSMDIIVSVNGLVRSPKDLFDGLREPCDLKLYVSTPAS